MINVIYEKTLWNVYRVDNHFEIVDFKNISRTRKFKEDEFYNLVQENVITIEDDYTEKSNINLLMVLHDINNISKKTSCKKTILEIYNEIPDGYTYNQKILYIKKRIKGEFDFSNTTIYRLIKDYERCGRTLQCLNPKKQTRSSSIDDTILEIVKKRILKDYASPKRINIKTLYESIKIDLDIIGIDIKKAPSYQTICNYIKKYSYEYKIEKSRLGSKEYHKRHGPVFNGVQTTYPLERVEIDHTELDIKVFVIDEKNKKILYGRPLLTVIKDHFTKSFLGYHLSFNAPDTEVALKCLKHAMQKKENLKDKYPEIDEEWIQHGRFKNIVADNGLEFKSERFKETCLQLGVHLTYTAKYEPWLKATVESAFNNIKSLLNRLPSRIRKDTIHGQKIKDDVLSFEDFDFLFNLWVVSDYHNKYNATTESTPNKLWIASNEKKEILDSELSNEDLNIILSEKITRRLSRKGIVYANVRYNSNALNELYLKNKKIEATALSVQFKLNHNDISSIHVYDEIDKSYLQVNNIDGIPSNFTFKDLKNKNKIRNLNKREINEIHAQKSFVVNQQLANLNKKSKYDTAVLRKERISNENPRIKPKKKPLVVNSIPSIYADVAEGGLFGGNE